MKFQVYKKSDGTKELRLTPESEEDCDEIDDCSQCYYEESDECEDDTDTGNPASLILTRRPGMSHSPQIPTFEEFLKQIGYPGPVPQMNIEARLFAIENGKVVSDPETMELLNRLGLTEKIERSIKEEEEEN